MEQDPGAGDDGAASHLTGARIPPVALPATDGTSVTLSSLKGRVVLFAYPRTGSRARSACGRLGHDPARRTPQTCAFRDLFKDLKDAGAQHVFGISTQDSAYQREMAERLHVPFRIRPTAVWR